MKQPEWLQRARAIRSNLAVDWTVQRGDDMVTMTRHVDGHPEDIYNSFTFHADLVPEDRYIALAEERLLLDLTFDPEWKPLRRTVQL